MHFEKTKKLYNELSLASIGIVRGDENKNKVNNQFKEEYDQYINDEVYFIGCPFHIYSSNYNKRLRKFLSEYQDSLEISFIENELVKLQNFYLNRFSNLLSNENELRISLSIRKTESFLENLAKGLGYVEKKGSIKDAVNRVHTKIDKGNHDNPHSRIFKDFNSFELFDQYTKKHIIEPYIDYSYLFQRMRKENLILNTTHKNFMYWLFDEKYISEKVYERFIDKENFRSLSKSFADHRINNYNNLFQTNTSN